MPGNLNYCGLVVAGIGFFLTRFTVTLAISQDPIRFYLGGVVPLALGLGLAAFGVALTVADVEADVVRTTAVWSVIGAATMLVLVVLTLLGAAPESGLDLESVRSQTYLSNFLVGGSIGGTLTGLYASRNRRQRRMLRQQRNRLEVLNRVLRHEVLNAITAIRGHVALEDDPDGRTESVVADRSADIEDAIEEVKYLTRQADPSAGGGTPVPLAQSLAESVATVTDDHSDVGVAIDEFSEDLAVRADGRLSHLFTHLLENAIRHGEDEHPAVEVTADRSAVRVSVVDAGSGLPESQQRLLESGDIEEFDDPTTGFGLNIVRLLVESYGGHIDTEVDGETRITVSLPRAETEDLGLSPGRHLSGVGTAIPHLSVVLVAAVIAGVLYGAASEVMGEPIAGIGVFYGTASPIVGWITHEFHSVVFSFVYVGLLGLVPVEYRDRLVTFFAVGMGWALVLWLGAAGVVAPFWLQLLGIPAPIPSFQGYLLVNHLVWGLSLAGLTALGFRYVTPRLPSW
ncbi:MAG: HAMP domain-containing sensor histidine kinase [Haloarculaceae archaeon]